MSGPEVRPRVLVVDDEESVAELVSMTLALDGIETAVAHSGADGLDAVRRMRPHLVVLDLMLPDMDGFEVLRRLSWEPRTASVPVILLTAKGSVDDRIAGLAAGGDDYLAKPFHLDELRLRVQAVLRRTIGSRTDAELVECGDIRIDRATYEVTRRGRTIALSPTEYRLLEFLADHAGQVVSKAQIIDHVWTGSALAGTNLVEVYVSYLRRKLDAAGPPVISTVRGVGYVLRPVAAEPSAPGAAEAPGR